MFFLCSLKTKKQKADFKMNRMLVEKNYMSSGKKIHTPKFAKKKKAKQQHMDGSVGQ
jgi:hypothetical protein